MLYFSLRDLKVSEHGFAKANHELSRQYESRWDSDDAK